MLGPPLPMTAGALYGRARRASVWGALELVVRQSVQLLALLGLALLLDPHDFGLMAMVLAFTAFGALFSDFGLGTALVQKQDATPADETAVMMVNLCLAFTLAVMLVLAAPAIAAFYAEPLVTGLAQLLALTFPLGALATVPDAMLTKRLSFKSRARVELVASIAAAGLALVLALRGYGVWSLAWQAVAYGAIRAAMLWAISGWRPCMPLDARGLPTLVRFGGYMLAANLVDTVYNRLQALLIGRLAGAREAGLYTMAQNIPQAPGAFIGSLMHRVGLPLMASIHTDRDRAAEALRRVLSISLFLFAPLMLSLALVSAPLVEHLLGQRWLGTSDLLVPLALATMFWPWHVLNVVALNAAGRSDTVLKIELPKKAMAISLLLAASPLGAEAMAWSVFVTSLLSVPFNTIPLGPLLGAGLVDQLRTVGKTLWLLSAAGAAGLASRTFCAETGLMALAPAGVALLVFGVGASLLSHPAIRELRRMQQPGDSLSPPERP